MHAFLRHSVSALTMFCEVKTYLSAYAFSRHLCYHDHSWVHVLVTPSAFLGWVPTPERDCWVTQRVHFLVHSVPPDFSSTCGNTCLVQHSTWATFAPTRSLQRFFILPDAHQTLVLIPTSQARSCVVGPLLPTPFGFPLRVGAWRTCRQPVFILVGEGVRVCQAHGSILWRVCRGLVRPSQLLHVDAFLPRKQLIL